MSDIGTVSSMSNSVDGVSLEDNSKFIPPQK